MVTVHVDRCPTCKGDKYVGQGPWCLRQPCPTCQGTGRAFLLPSNCSDCNGRGWQIPEWIKVPTVTDRQPHPDWQPGASITFTADCEHERAEQLDGTNDWSCPDCGTKGHDISEWDDGQIVVAERVIAELVPVESNQTAERDHDHVAITREGKPFLWRCLPFGHAEPLDVDCTPGDLLARLETS